MRFPLVLITPIIPYFINFIYIGSYIYEFKYLRPRVFVDIPLQAISGIRMQDDPEGKNPEEIMAHSLRIPAGYR
jgi:hypothetical protein